MTRRVLILMDDYNEATRIETMLKKLGFDTISQVTEAGLQELLLGFRPDLIVLSGHGAKLNAASVGQKLKESKAFTGRVLIGLPQGIEMTAQDFLRVRVDRIVDLPSTDENLLRHICELLGMESRAMIEKMRKAFYLEAPELVQLIRSGEESNNEAPEEEPEPAEAASLELRSKLSREDRAARAKAYASELDLDRNATTLSRQAVKETWANVRKAFDEEALARQDRLKREFTQALFENPEAELDRITRLLDETANKKEK